MLINQDGSRDNKIVGILLSDRSVILTDNQFFQITQTGKRIELFEELNGLVRKVTHWNMSSVIATILKSKGAE